MKRAPLPEIAALLDELLAGLHAVLGSQMVGLYLHGSLAAGDFNPERSDIDFVVVTQQVLPAATVVGLSELHRRLVAGGSRWAAELEGSYVPAAALRHYDPDEATFPHVGRYGALRVERHASDWILQLHVLREHGMALAGPPPRTLVDPIGAAALRRATRETLHEWWEPKLADPAILMQPGYQAYTVLTMCRILYTSIYGEVVSKPTAARWLLARAPQWEPLVTAALRWRHGDPPGSLADTFAFIRFTLVQSEKLDE